MLPTVSTIVRTGSVFYTVILWIGSAWGQCSSTSYLALVMADGPTAYYRLNESPPNNNAVAVDQVGLRHGVYRSNGGQSPVSVASAYPTTMSTGVLFDKTLDTMVAADLHAPPVGSFTVEMWMRTPDTTGSRYILDIDNNHLSITLGYAPGGMELFGCGVSCQAASVISVPDAAWHHYAWVFNGPGATLATYVDGSHRSSSTTTCNCSGSAFPSGLTVGAASPGGTPNNFNGAVDELVLYWGQALSATKIAQRVSGASCPSPIPTPTRTATSTPGPRDCCQCGGAPACGRAITGSCGACDTVFDADCDAGTGLCLAFTPTPTLTPTRTETPTITPTHTSSPTPSSTPTQSVTRTPTPTPTHTPGAADCCQCAGLFPACGPPAGGRCGFGSDGLECVSIYGARCGGDGYCWTLTPTATPTETPTGTSTPTETLSPTETATATDTPTKTPTSTPTATPSATPTDTPTLTPTVTYTPTDTPAPTVTGTDTPTPTSTPTDTPTPSPTIGHRVHLVSSVARPGGLACVALSMDSLDRESLAEVLHSFLPGTWPERCSRPADGPGWNVNVAGQDVVIVADTEPIVTCLGPTCPLQLATCELAIAGNWSVGRQSILHEVTASLEDGRALGGMLAVPGAVTLSECTGDCDGNGEVSIGEVTRCVNMFLGRPVCDPLLPHLSCPIADANGNGVVSIGEISQCIQRYLTGCDPQSIPRAPRP